MTNRYLLDSSAWIEYFRGTTLGKRVKEILEHDDIATCMLSIAEIADKFSREKESFETFLQFIKNASTILPLTFDVCARAGTLKAERRTAKKEFGLADALIYLTAQEHTRILVTKDDDFSGIERVVILD
ncbi:MAG: PIN domain-containing protein [Candidatus Aenigmarchaeota archaeon]|nr:PIN domain-containing protein [Candidatus Aenigmarchaeota archaeon]